MAVMAQPWKHPRSGIYYFRREVPAEIRALVGRREWKVSLKTRDLAVARPRFASESARCEEVLAAAREQLAGRPKVLASDAPRLADRWAKSVLESWNAEPEQVEIYLGRISDLEADDYSEAEYQPACDLLPEGDDSKSRYKVISRFLSASLTEAGLPLPDSADPAFRALVDAFFARWCDVCRMAYARYSGDWRSRLELPAADEPLALQLSKSRSTAPKLSEVYQQWADDKRTTDGENRSTAKTVAEFGTIITRFIELKGDMAVDQISRLTVHEFRIALGKLPTQGKGLRGLSAPQLIAKAEAEGLPTASLGTVKKQLRALSTVLHFAKRRLGVIQEDPVSASGIIAQLAKAAQRATTISEEEKGYTWSELMTIFRSPIYTQGWQPPRADYGGAFYWLPLLMVYTGARREELTQLAVSDVVQDESTGIWYLSIRPGEGQTVKTASSRRKVPLHGDLLQLGFLEYKDTLPVDGRLFPKLTSHPSEGFGHNFGKLWAKYLRDVVGLKTSASPAHGFRHAFKTLCRESGIPGEVHDWITGHSAPNVGATYGKNPLSRMALELAKFPTIAIQAGVHRCEQF